MEKLLKSLFSSSQTSIALLIAHFILWIAIVFDIPVTRQVIGFIFLTFVPGFAILRLLKSEFVFTEKVLFSAGLSIVFSMGIGLLINSFAPFLGFFKPLSTESIILALSIPSFAFVVVGWNKKRLDAFSISGKQLVGIIVVLGTLPALSIIGTIWARSSDGTNVLLLGTIVLLAIVFAFATLLTKRLSSEMYCLLALSIAVALLLQLPFVSNRLIGFDIWNENYVFTSVLQNSYWNPQLPFQTNAMLSVSILPTIYSNLLNMSSDWVLKLIYPLLFSLVALGVYQLCSLRLSKELAFVSTIFFVAYPTFFTDLVMLSRQMIGEIFYVLLFLTLFSKNLPNQTKWFFSLFFSFGLIVSHYSLAYIFLIFMVIVYSISILRKRLTSINISYIVSFSVMAFAWYVFTAASRSLDVFVFLLGMIRANFVTEFLEPTSRGEEVLTATGVQATVTFWHLIGRMFFYGTVLLIIIGFVYILIREKRKFFDENLNVLAFLNLLLIIACIVVPYFATSFNLSRFYQIALFFLAPFFVLGGVSISRLVLKVRFLRKRINEQRLAVVLLLVVLIPYFLIQTGFVYEVTKEESWTLPLSVYRFTSSTKATRGMISEAEVQSAKWLATYRYYDRNTYADVYSAPLFYEFVPNIVGVSQSLPGNSSWYLYLREHNINDGIIYTQFSLGSYINTTIVIQNASNADLVYSSGSTVIYATP